MQANETSAHETQVQALSDLLCSRPAQCQAPTSLLQVRVPPGQQGRQPTPLVSKTPEPGLFPWPDPGRACPAVAQSQPGLLATPGGAGPPCVTRGLNTTRDAKTNS